MSTPRAVSVVPRGHDCRRRRILANRPYYLLLNPNDQNSLIAYASIAERLNTTFHTTADPNLKVGGSQNKELILLNVPYNVPAQPLPIPAGRPPGAVQPGLGERARYRQKLEEELARPVHDTHRRGEARSTRRRLPAACRSAWKARRRGCGSRRRKRRTSANRKRGRNSRGSAEDHPAFGRVLHGTASIDDSLQFSRLVEMLSSTDVELRQGAYIAVRLADERHPSLSGMLMAKSYWLHRLAPDAPPAVSAIRN